MERQAALLLGSNVKLTALHEEDLPVIARWYENDRFTRLLDARPAIPRNASEFKSWLSRDEKELYLAIRQRNSDLLLGYIVIDGILWNHRVGWLAMAIGEPANWNKGYGSEALCLMVDFAFRELNLRRLQLTVFSYNDRAIALYEKLGFQKEGVYREFLERDGENHDMLLYGLLRKEWNNETLTLDCE